jgi:hypothetical protein
MQSKFLLDIEIIKKKLKGIPKYWDGKKSILELKQEDYHWKQMEWWAFYFELKCLQLLKKEFEIPGETIGNVKFDLKGKINWDIKASAIKTDNHKIILNDIVAMQKSVLINKFHGEIIGLCDVEYNDINRTFQKWHTELKGGKSKYEIERESRTSISRYRKTSAELKEVILVIFSKYDFEKLYIMKQGRNSNGKPRKEKYMLDLEDIHKFKHYIIKL